MDTIYQQKVINANSVFDKGFLDNRALYLFHYNSIPNVNLISRIDGEKAFNAFMEQFGSLITSIHTFRPYDHDYKRYDFSKTTMVLNNGCVVEIGVWYCEILHNGIQDEFIGQCTGLVQKFRDKIRRKPLEINIIVSNYGGLELKSMEVKRTRLNLDLFYEDDFRDTDAIICNRLNRKNDKGIVLLHGLPGTGKTTYLRYLIGKIKKRVLFLSPNIAGSLVNPDLIDLLVDNPDSVIIIEDAESIIADRKYSNDSSVSNLLNISDGLLADFLNVQLICTFNSTLTHIDQALLRKGRLIARYEFGRLSIPKAQKLSDHFGYKSVIHQPMTIAEITNQDEKDFQPQKIEVVGFRRQVLEN